MCKCVCVLIGNYFLKNGEVDICMPLNNREKGLGAFNVATLTVLAMRLI